jgi:hypothetical protein
VTCGATVFSFLCHQPLEAVRILLPRHQHGVLGRHHHEIVDAFQCHQCLIGCDVAANNLQQSWRFDWEPPKAVLRDVWTIDWILGC